MVVDVDIQLRSILDEDAEARAEWEACQKLRNDPRITWLGQRFSSIDELPQLINFVLSDMSLVGPRPIVEEEIVRYREGFVDYQQARPRITGVWQLSGRNDTSFEQCAEFDRLYLQNWNFRGDVMIIMKTIPAVLLSGGC
jgi:exopolysaccharide production protein ExoY